MKTLPKRMTNLSDDTLDLCHRFVTKHVYKTGTMTPTGSLSYRTRCIHVADCIERGTITPMEGYDIEKQLETLGYLPEWIDTRESNYSHLI